MAPPNNENILRDVEARFSALLQQFLAPIQEELAALRYLSSLLAGTNTVPAASAEDPYRSVHIACQLVNSIFSNKATVSRFVAHCTVKELARTGAPFQTSCPSSSHPSSSCPTLLLAALSFSQFSSTPADSAKSKRSLISSPVGKKHVYLKRSIVGSAFFSMANDQVVRWKDSTSRKAGNVDPGEEDDLNMSTAIRSYPLRNATVVPQDKPAWVRLPPHALREAFALAMPTDEDNIVVPPSKRKRLSTGTDVDSIRAPPASSSTSRNSAIPAADTGPVMLATSALRALTKFFNNSRKNMKQELLKSCFFLLHQDFDAVLLDNSADSNQASFMTFNNDFPLRSDDSIPTTARAYGNSAEANKVYEENDRIFNTFTLDCQELIVQVTYTVSVTDSEADSSPSRSSQQRKALTKFSFLTTAMVLLTSFCQCPQRHLLCHNTEAILASYKIAICLKSLFSSMIDSDEYGRDGFPLVGSHGCLDLRDYIPGGELLSSFIRKKKNISAHEYDAIKFDTTDLCSIATEDLDPPCNVTEDHQALQEDEELGISLVM